MTHEDDDIRPGAFAFQPDPAKPYFVQPKAEKLVRRGPREYYIVGRTPDGQQIEARLGGGIRFKMEGI